MSCNCNGECSGNTPAHDSFKKHPPSGEVLTTAPTKERRREWLRQKLITLSQDLAYIASELRKLEDES